MNLKNIYTIILAIPLLIFVISFLIRLISRWAISNSLEAIKPVNDDRKAEVILNGRVYQAIKNCVQNRYWILASFFAYYAFLIINKEKFSTTNLNKVFSCDFSTLNFAVSLIFILVVIHNLFNYALNNRDERLLEGRGGLDFWEAFWASKMELVFSFVMFILIAGAYYLTLNLK